MVPPKPDSSLPAGLRTLAEHYQIVRKLGEGAFGEVFLARHDLLGQDFAIKLLKPELCEDEGLRQRFLDEARALIRFSHPNVVQMRHVGEHEGRLYLVMDYVGGGPLADLIQKEGPLDEGRAVQLMVQILAGLEAAHAAGIIHRDLKPSNILVEKRDDGLERLRILDFGLSKLSGVDSHRSVSGSVVGTLAYMSPEQLQGERNLDGRSDVFAAGLILMEMLQGHHPYPGESGIVVAAKLLRDPVPPLEAKRASKIAPSTNSALGQALQRDRDARFGSAVAFSQALMGKGPPSDTSKVTTIQEAKRELARQDAQKEANQRAQKTRTQRNVLVGVLALAVAGAAAFFLLGRKEPEPTPVAQVPAPRTTPESPTRGETTPPTPSPAPNGTPAPAVVPAGEKPDPAASTAPEAQPTSSQPAVAQPTTPPAPAPEVSAPTEAPRSPEVRPAPPEEATKPSVEPEPASAEPRPTEPTTPPTREPATPEPTPPEPEPTATPASAATLLVAADERQTSGRHAEARALYEKTLEVEPFEERALRGVGDAWLREADGAARRGATPEALKSLDAALAWWKLRYTAFEKQSMTADPEAIRVASGVSRAYLAETETERARWLTLSGDAAGAAAARKQATDHLHFANQFLNRDSVRYWEMLLQRAKLATLEGRLDVAVEDLAITTATNNVEVPAHMWVAHAVGLRRLAEAALAKNDKASAKKHALAAYDVVKRGTAWQRAKLTRDHYLDAARIVLVNALVANGAAERVPLQSVMKHYVTEAGNRAARADETPERSQARLAAARGAQGIVDGLTFADQRKTAESKAAFESAVAQALEAIRADEASAAKGGALVAPFSYRVLALAKHFLGDTAGAQAATQSAGAASAKNPE